MNVQLMQTLSPKERIDRLYRLNELIEGMRKMPDASPLALADAIEEAKELKKLIKKDVGRN